MSETHEDARPTMKVGTASSADHDTIARTTGVAAFVDGEPTADEDADLPRPWESAA